MTVAQYSLLVQAMRAVFIVLAALTVLRASLSLLAQHRERRKLLRRLPDAGMVGEMRDIESDISYPLPREGVLGGSAGCDIRLKGLRRRQVTFSFVDGKGVLIRPCRRRTAAWLDGVEIRKGAYALPGALLRVGGYTLRIRLFAGLDVPEASQYQDHWRPAYEEEFYPPDGLAAFGPGGGVPPAFPDYPDDGMPPAFPDPVPVTPQDAQQACPPDQYMQDRFTQVSPEQNAPYPGDPQDPSLPVPETEGPAPAGRQERHRRSDRRRKK